MDRIVAGNLEPNCLRLIYQYTEKSDIVSVDYMVCKESNRMNFFITE